MKPILSEKHKKDRLKCCLSFIDSRSLIFSSMNNIVHIDEKWFYMTKAVKKVYISDNETVENRSGRNRRFIPKVMFLSAVVRPRFDGDGDCIFDGKLGIWAFTKIVPAQRSSKNRSKFTLEHHFINITKKVYKECLLEKVIPAIMQKWPSRRPWSLLLQHDNAPAHVPEDDPDVIAAGNYGRTSVKLIAQPANSLDFNINDLGFFRAIQSLQDECCPSSVEELVGAVKKAYVEYDPKKIEDTFISLQKCMEASM